MASSSPAALHNVAIPTLSLLNRNNLHNIPSQLKILVDTVDKEERLVCNNKVALVHQFVEKQAQKTPTRIAVKDSSSSQKVTYNELNVRANRLANYLLSEGVGNDQLVGVCVDRSVDLIIAVLAILKAGGAYLPLDPTYPQERLFYMLKLARASVILTDSHVVPFHLTDQVEHVVRLDTKWPKIALYYSPENPHTVVTATGESLAYVIYTSGSTGKPKGVALPHRALVNLIDWQIYGSDVTTGPTLQYTPISFDVSFQEIFSTLGIGGTLIMIADETRRDPYHLLEVLAKESVERLFLSFVALQYLAEAGATQQLEHKLKLKEVITAGEQLRVTPALVKWFQQMPGCSLHNHYGPSESHVVTAYRLQDDPETWPLLPPIGQALPHVQIHLLDQNLRPVADGEDGEIYIGGDCLAREYLHRPDLTAERFIESPNGIISKTNRLYKTGDLARCLPGGIYEFLGRGDQQIKIRGYRIEPGEVEAVLEQHPEVSEAVVVACSDRPAHKHLVGYVITSLHQNQASSLHQYLKDRLPNYMVPTAIVCLEKFPLTPSGKVDRNNLPAPGQQVTGPSTVPATDLEQKLAAIWASVLGIDNVGLEDDFFELGGDSLLATRVITRIRETVSHEIYLLDFFETPQLGPLASLLSTKALSVAHGRLPLQQGNRPDQLPPSWVQEPLWFLNQLMTGHPFYNVPEAFQIEGPLSVSALSKSIQTVLDRHETLRTTFEEVEGKPVQIIHEKAVCPVSVVDLLHLPMAEQERQVQAQLVAAARVPFDLSRDVLLRASIFKLSKSSHILFLNLHHIVCDGWSIGILMQELEQLYTANLAGAASPLPPLPVQYADFSHWQRQSLSQEQLEQQLAYWKQQLGGTVPTLSLPTDFPRPAMPTYNGGREFLTLSKELTDSLKDLAKVTGTTLFMVLLASFQTLLYRYSGQDNIAVGTFLANRPLPELESMIGFFPNTLVLRSDLSGVPSFRTFLKRVREVTMGAHAHQDLPFEHLVQALDPDHELGKNPLVQVIFNLQNTPPASWDRSDMSLKHLNVDNHTTKFDLFLELTESPSEMTGYLEYSTDLFKSETIARMGNHLIAVLESVVANPDLMISDLSISSTSELQQLADWNDTKLAYPKHLCLHQLIEAQVEETPAVTALQFTDTLLTYESLNQHANQCANYLRKLGVAPGKCVGLFMDRSPDLLIAMLAVMKAGGTYVPLDPIYPSQRLAFMMQDSNLAVLLTEKKTSAKIPMTTIKVVYLDQDWSHIAQESKRNLTPTSTPEDLIYILYTSGSTGKPKGVQVKNRSVVNLLWHSRNRPFITTQDTMLALTTVCFDIAVTELLLPLIVGAKIVLAPREVAKDPQKFARILDEANITVAQTTPSGWRMLVNSGWQGTPGLKLLTIGEMLSRDLADQLLERGDSLWNLYGPTETTVYSSLCQVTTDCNPVPIGHPVANTKLYLANPSPNNGETTWQPVPVGIVGELFIGGDGLARGYLNRPDTTKEKFIPDPFDADPNARLYCTGDLARYLPDGTLECLGRTDHQIKIRGYRIELGDIESCLRRQDGIRAAVVVARENSSGDGELAAYIITEVDEAQSKDQTQQWESIWDETYRQSPDESESKIDPTLNLAGWISSYTGLATPVEEMHEWIGHTIDRIMTLNPRRLFEIGCGSGLLLYRLAPHCQAYRGIDLSTEAVCILQKQLKRAHPKWDVDVGVGAADSITVEDLSDIDTVVINSVAQYFPSIEYFVEVLSSVVKGLKPGSCVFLGDLRSFPLLSAFHTAIQLFEADSSTTIQQLKARIHEHVSQESELLIAPDFFIALQHRLPSIRGVEIQLKRGQHHNELTQFRYDVVLSIGQGLDSSPIPPSATMQWQQSTTLKELEKHLQDHHPCCLKVQTVPNARLVSTMAAISLLQDTPAAVKTVADLREALRLQIPIPSIDPEEIWQLGSRLEYKTLITNSDCHKLGTFDVMFQRQDLDLPSNATSTLMLSYHVEDKNWQAYANQPTSGHSPTIFIPDLRKGVAEQLPEYMVPSTFTVMSSFPLTPNGKVDRQALPEPAKDRSSSANDFVSPRNSVESIIAELWEEVLSVAVVGVEDNFFELGGHSMLAAELMFRLKQQFDVNLQLINIFTTPTVAGQAELICDHRSLNPSEEAPVDLWAESSLPEDIYARTRVMGNVENPKAVLLTGATGFLGGFLAHEILKQTQADLYCLVRAEDEIKARQRIKANLELYDLWEPKQASRIVPIVGDLGKPQLSLSSERLQFLTETIDVIYHNGAMVNFMHPYSVMKETNVSATETILRLASQVKVKHVHYVSTLGVFSPLAYPDKQLICEKDQARRVEGLYGYTQSKWVAEKKIAIAQSRGIPTTIYRPAWVEGHSVTGVCNQNDFLRSMIKGCLQLGVAPDWVMPIDLAPVDFISQAMVSLSRDQVASGASLNFVNPKPMMWNQLIDWLTTTYGYCLERIAYKDWHSLIKTEVRPGSDNALAPFLAFLTDDAPQYKMTIPEIYFRDCGLEFDTSDLQEGLANHVGKPFPSVESLLPTYFDYFMKSGFLDPPALSGVKMLPH